MNRIYKVVFNRAKGEYQVVSELAKNAKRSSGSSLLRSILNSGGVATRNVLAALLIFGGACVADAAQVNDGDQLEGSPTITVTKDDATKTITISTVGVATETELNQVKGDVGTNERNIATNKADIETNKGNIETNKGNIETNRRNIATNTADITELKAINTALGIDKNKPGIKYFRANSTGNDASATGTDAIAIGVDSKAAGKDSIAMGDDARTTSFANNSIAIGRKAISGATAGMTGDGSSTTVIVNGGKSSVSIGDGANARANSSIALGDNAVVYNDGANAALNSNSMAIGTNASTVASNNAIALGKGALVDKNSNSAIAAGDAAKASAEAAVAIGKEADASGKDSMALGTGAVSGSANSLAFGNTARTGGADAIAIGNKSNAAGGYSIAMGTGASAAAARSIALGPDAGIGMVGDVLGSKGSHVVIGDHAGNNVDGQQNIAIGYKTGSNVKSDHNIAIGSEAGLNIGSAGNSSEGKNVSIGYQANKNDSAVSRIQSTAVGSESKAVDDAAALGYLAQALGNGSTAVGFNAKATDAASMALGQGSSASGGNIAIGNGSVANASMISGTGYLTGQAAPSTAVSVGTSSALRRIVNVADGAQDQDAVTVAQLKKSIDATVAQINANIATTTSGINYDPVTSGEGDSITLRNTDNKGTKIHNVADGTLDTDATNVRQVNQIVNEAKTHYYSVKSTNMNNYANDLASGEDSMAAGVGAKALETRSVAIGNNTEAQSVGGITLGVGYEEAPGSLKQTMAISGYEYNMAIGAGAQSAGNSSLAIGTLATSSIKNGGTSVDKAVAIGYSAGVSDDKAIAIGNEAKSNSKRASAIGSEAQALAEDALAIGTTSKAEGMSSGAIGTNNRVVGENTYVFGAQNNSSATPVASVGVTATNSGIFGNTNKLEGDSNRIVGNNNAVIKESISQSSSTPPKDITNIMVTGNDNTVSGDPDSGTAGDAGNVSGITITGSKNRVVAKNNSKDLKDIQIVGNNNQVDTSNANLDLSNTQILGSNVRATMGNSVYLGSGSSYVPSGNTTRGMNAYNSNGKYNFAGGTPVGVITVGAVGQERRIQNVAAGLISASSTDAVNGSQLYSMTLPLRFGGDNSTIGATVSADTNVISRGSNDGMYIKGGAAIGNLSDNNIGVVSDTSTNTLTVKLAKDVTGLNSLTATTVNGTTIKAGDTTITTNGMTITGGPSVTKTGINAGGKQITNVLSGGDNETNGANIGDVKKAVNTATTNITNNLTDKGFGLQAEDGKQVHKKLGEFVQVVGDGKNISTTVDDNGRIKVALSDDLRVNSVTAGDTSITTNGLTITGGPSITKDGIDAGGKQITNVASGGDVDENGANIGDIKRIVEANKTVLVDGKNTTVTGSGSASDPYKVNVNDNLSLGQNGADGVDGSIGVNGKDGSGVFINGADGSIGMKGKDGENGLTMKSEKGEPGLNGTDGMTRIVYTDDEQVTHEVATLDDGLNFAGNTGSTSKKLNSTMTIKGTGDKADSEYDSSNIKTMVNDDGEMIIGLDKNLKADSLTVGGPGKDGQDGVNGSIGVKGADGKDGVVISSIGKDGQDGTDGHIGINGKDGASADIHVVKGSNGVDGTDGYGGTDGIDRIVYEDHNGNTHTVATMNDGMKYGGDTGEVINKKLNEQVNVIGGITDESQFTNEDNLGVVSDGSNNLKVRLSKDLKGLNTVETNTINAGTGNITTVNATTVKTGDTVMNNEGVTIHNGAAGQDVSLTKDGLNNGGNKITNVAPGTVSANSTDAINGSQLYRTENRISKLGDRVDRVGAGAAALAGLHPLDFDPDDKWDVAAGYGNYRGAHAVAVGAYYRPNEDTMFSVGGSFSGHEKMVNVGVSLKFGQANNVSRSRVSMAKDMLAMKAQIEALTNKLAVYEAGGAMPANVNATEAMAFPDVPENHWAYQYVKSLAERGYLKGYPDGEFKGDRAMTRYEYAAIIYRALQNGAPSDGNMARSVEEFGPELTKVQNIDRFRVDRISGEDDDRHKVERVRINDKDDRDKNVYRDVYGSHITKQNNN